MYFQRFENIFNPTAVFLNYHRDFLLIVSGGLYLFLANGYRYFYSNQTQYFVYGLRLSNPDFLPNDWFTWQIFHHDIGFGYLIYLLNNLGPLFITVTLMEVTMAMILAGALYWLCQRLANRVLPVYGLVLVWVGMTMNYDIALGGQQIYSSYLQPSEVAGPLMMLGMVFLLYRQYRWAGLCLGIGGFFHAAYLASFAPIVGMTALAQGILKKPKAMIQLAVPLVIGWGGLISILMTATGSSSPPTEQTMQLMTHLRAPLDFIVTNWDYQSTIAWIIWALITTTALVLTTSKKVDQVTKISFLVALVTSGWGVLFSWLELESLAILMLWRSSPWILAIGIVVLMDWLIEVVFYTQLVRRKDWVVLGLYLGGIFGLSFFNWGPDQNSRFLWLMILPMSYSLGIILYRLNDRIPDKVRLRVFSLFFVGLIISAFIFLKEGWRFIFVYSLPVTILASMIVARRIKLNQLTVIRFSIFTILLSTLILTHTLDGVQAIHNYEANPSTTEEAELEAWIKRNTSQKAILVVPPNMEYMRIRGHRAIVVDWKSPSYLPDDLLVWKRRLEDISGISIVIPGTTSHDLFKGYQKLDTERAQMLRDKYQATYVVIKETEHSGNLENLIKVFANKEYSVYEIN